MRSDRGPACPTRAFLSTAEFGRRVGISATSGWRVCQRHPGFAVRAGGTYRIPVSHAERIERAEASDHCGGCAKAEIHRRGLDIPHMHLLDRAVEVERRFIVIIERDGRAERDANVETIIGGEDQRRADRTHASAKRAAIAPDAVRCPMLSLGGGLFAFPIRFVSPTKAIAAVFVH